VPSGNVTAFVRNGVLQISGDAQANQIWVTTGAGIGDAVVTPLGTTTVNGGRGPVNLSGITAGADIRLRGGDDFLWLTNTVGIGSVFASMGAGNNGVTIDHANHKGETVLWMGDGNNTISFGMGEYVRNVTVRTGDGNNRVYAGGTRFAALSLHGGTGVNVAGFQDVDFRSQPVVTGFREIHPTFMPTAVGDRVSVRAGNSVTINVTANDLGHGWELASNSVQIVGRPQHGTARVNADGTVTYTADNSAAASDTFRYIVRNVAGVASNVAAVTVTRNGDGTPGAGAGPVPTITTTAGNQTNLTAIPFTVTFDRDVTRFTLADLVVTNGVASNFTAVNARTYTFSVTPTVAGAVVVRVPAGAAIDSQNRGNVVGTRTITFDNIPPTATISAAASVNPGEIPITVVFSENVTGFTAADATVTGGTVSGFVQVSPNVYRFTVTSTGSDLVSVNIPAGVATDAAGNPNTAALTYTSTPTRTDDGMLPTTSPPNPNAPEWQFGANGLGIWDVQTGTGPGVTSASTIGVFYTGWLLDGTVFDSARTDGSPATFALSGLIQGWQEGLLGLRLGGIRRLYIPSELGYGPFGQGIIPPNADLIFEIKLVSLI
jgi:VCBS repeat-containing protein